MDARIGLDYIVENREYVSKLGAALDTNNSTVKKQVFELLSALCAYNSEGYLRAIETLEYYKVSGHVLCFIAIRVFHLFLTFILLATMITSSA